MDLVYEDKARQERATARFTGTRKEKSHTNLREEYGLFMWFELFIEILIRMNLSDDRQELINICRKKFKNNTAELKKIEEFAETYSPKDAIKWYTKDAFLFRMLNEALRTKNFVDLIPFRFFIRDFSCQLEFLYKQQQIERSNDPVTYHVYRGQLMAKDEIEHLQNNIGQVISMNTILSTSKDREVAVMFAGDKNDQLQSVLFEIEINNPLVVTKSYANIAHLSKYDEDEIVFMLGALFRVKSMQKNAEKQHWLVRIQVCDEHEASLKELSDYMKNGVTRETSFIDLGWYFKDIGEYDLATQCYERMQDTLEPGDLNLARCYNGLGAIASLKSDYDEKLECYQMQIAIRSQLSSSDHPAFAFSYNNLGSAYRSKGDYEEALECYAKALSIYSVHKEWGENHRETAACYSNIGGLFLSMNDKESALLNYMKALDIQEKTLPPIHRDIANVCYQIGHMHLDKHEYTEANNYLTRSLDINLKSHPNPKTNRHIGDTYKYIGVTYEHLDKLELALEMYIEASKIYQNVYSSQDSSHPTILNIHLTIETIISKIIMKSESVTQG